MSCEKCERDIERLRGELNVLRSEMIEVVGGMLARVDEVLAKVQTSNRQMFAHLRAQTDAGFASLRACIDAASRTERKDDEPPKLN
jgi:mevalonate pyrophosphate decarboxylase